MQGQHGQQEHIACVGNRELALTARGYLVRVGRPDLAFFVTSKGNFHRPVCKVATVKVYAGKDHAVQDFDWWFAMPHIALAGPA